MTEVTNKNFEQLYPVVCNAIKEASFIALDTELTGLHANQRVRPSLFDSVEDRYQKQRLSVSTFTLSQVGLVCFTRHPCENKYEAKCFSFYICPRSSGDSNARKFSFDSACLEFLCYFNFEFNKFAYQGISCLNEEEEKRLNDDLDNQVIFDLSYPSEDEVAYVRDKISVWQANLCANELKNNINGKQIKNNCQYTEYSKTKQSQIIIPFKPTINPFTNYLMLLSLRAYFTDVWIERIGDNFLVKLVDPDEMKQLQFTHKQEREEVVNSILGFTRVFRVLKESKKPIVGHNLLTDLLFLYHWCHKPLPKKLSAFKEEIVKCFPSIYDTKHIAFNMKNEFPELKKTFEKTNLTQLYKETNTSSFLVSFLFTPLIIQRFPDNTESSKQTNFSIHEASYDAFITGCIFIRLAHALEMKDKRSPKAAPDWFEHLNAVKPFKHRVNLMRGNIHYMTLDGLDPPSNRPQWLYIDISKKKDFSLSKALAILSTHGTLDFKPLSKTEALIAVGNFNAARDMIKTFQSESDVQIKKYNRFRHNKLLRNTIITIAFSSVFVGFMAYKRLNV